MGFGGPDSGPPACEASSSLSEPPPQPIIVLNDAGSCSIKKRQSKALWLYSLGSQGNSLLKGVVGGEKTVLVFPVGWGIPRLRPTH